MDYFNILNFIKEPFSNSPDPEFFYQSRQHLVCLQQLELSLHLRRGLNVVIGDVGIGKTTICRHLIRKFTDYEDIDTHLILDPLYNSPGEFLSAVAEKFDGHKPPPSADDHVIKEIVKHHLYQKGVHEKKKVILIIDEGQKIPDFCLEILREFLNYETNKYKLLQIVIFAQKEFKKSLKAHANFADRINYYHLLKPLDFTDTRKMINFRLRQSVGTPQKAMLFSYAALRAVYRVTGGYPRKIVNLCHQCIIAMLVQNRTEVDWLLVNSCAKKIFPKPSFTWHRLTGATALGIFAFVVLMAGIAPNQLRLVVFPGSGSPQSVVAVKADKSDVGSAAAPLFVQTAVIQMPTVEAPTPKAVSEFVAGKGTVEIQPGSDKHRPADTPIAKKTVVSNAAQRVSETAADEPQNQIPLTAPIARYSVQVGAFRVAENAERIYADLLARGYAPYIFRSKSADQKTWFTVRIGDFADFRSARAAARAFEEKEKINTAVTRNAAFQDNDVNG